MLRLEDPYRIPFAGNGYRYLRVPGLWKCGMYRWTGKYYTHSIIWPSVWCLVATR